MPTTGVIVDINLKTNIDTYQIGSPVGFNSLFTIWSHIVGYKLMKSVWILIDTFMWVHFEHKSLFQSQIFTKNLQVPNLKIQKQLIKYVNKTLIIN
jgi:hypothetical protein